MKILVSILCLGLLTSTVYAEESYKEQLRQFKLVYIELLENKVEKIPVGTTIQVSLKDGTTVRGFLKGYYPHSDALWVRPLDSRFGIFSDEAYDIRQIQDVNIIVLRSI